MRDVQLASFVLQRRESGFVTIFNMSMKENLVYWAEAVERAENKDNSGALEKFSYITEPFARIFYNMAAIYLRQKNISKAEFVSAIRFSWGCIYLKNYLP